MHRTAVAALGVLLCLSAPARAELLVNISKSQQRLSVVIDGTEAYRWPISTGRRGYETPSGIFHPIRLERHWYSRKYDNSPMPWSVFFHRGYAVHGTMEAYNLGRAVSHGCVRLRPDKAAILFSLVRKRSAGNVRLVVMNGPLPLAPGARPMAEMEGPAMTPTERHFAGALATVEAHNLSAKTHADTAAADKTDKQDKPPVAKLAPIRVAHAVVHRVSVGSDEARVLREREAWLRSLDRKYGIAR